jgi:hypothetical protein
MEATQTIQINEKNQSVFCHRNLAAMRKNTYHAIMFKFLIISLISKTRANTAPISYAFEKEMPLAPSCNFPTEILLHSV